MKRIVIRIICFIGAFLCFIWSTTFWNGSGLFDSGEDEVYTDKLVVVSPALDEDFKINSHGPVLIRTVEMLQYYENGFGSIDTTWSSDDKFDVEIEENGRRVNYANPGFPKGLDSKIFYGDVTIGDNGPYVSDKLLTKLTYGSYIDFESSGNVYQLTTSLPPGGGVKHGLELADGYYISGDGTCVGDLRVSFYTVDMTKFDKFTIAGVVDDGEIGPASNDLIYFYDRVMSMDEISEKSEGDNKFNLVITTALTILLLFIAVWVCRKHKQKSLP